MAARVELVTELGHFVGGLPSNPAEAGMSSQVGHIVGKSSANTLKITYGVSRAAHSAHHEIPGLTPHTQTPPAVLIFFGYNANMV